MLKVGMRVRFVPQPNFWDGPNTYRPPPGATGVVTFMPKPDAYGGCVGVAWDDGVRSWMCGLNAGSLLPM